jgi:hypothetical protein
MARINDEAQWIVLIGFIVAASLFFLAIIVNDSTIVGQTTSESVLDFSKADIQNINLKTKDLAMYPINIVDPTDISSHDIFTNPEIKKDIENLYRIRKGVIIKITVPNPPNSGNVALHYNDGITSFNAYNEEK